MLGISLTNEVPLRLHAAGKVNGLSEALPRRGLHFHSFLLSGRGPARVPAVGSRRPEVRTEMYDWMAHRAIGGSQMFALGGGTGASSAIQENFDKRIDNGVWKTYRRPPRRRRSSPSLQTARGGFPLLEDSSKRKKDAFILFIR